MSSHSAAKPTKTISPKVSVDSTSHISYEEHTRTFRILCGQSLYCFCISAERELEHLYWGPYVENFDLRFQLQKIRKTHFTTCSDSSHTITPRFYRSSEANIIQGERAFDTEIPIPKQNDLFHKTSTDKMTKRRNNLAWRSWNKDNSNTHHPNIDIALSDISYEPSVEESNSSGSVSSKSHDKLDHDLSDDSVSNYHEGDFEIKKDSDDISLLSNAGAEYESFPRIGSADEDEYKTDFDDFLITQSKIEDRERLLKSAKEDFEQIEIDNTRKNATEKMINSLNLVPPVKSIHAFESFDNLPNIKKAYKHTKRCVSQMPPAFSELTSSPSFKAFDESSGKLGKGSLNNEYSDFGTGDFRNPSFIITDEYNGSTISPLKYVCHKIYKGRITNSDEKYTPHLRHAADEETFSTLVVTLSYEASFLFVDLIYTSIHNKDAIARSVVFRNHDKRPLNAVNKSNKKIVERASSFTLDFDCQAAPYYLMQLSGSWGREREIIETKIIQGIQHFGSLRGISGHQHSPFAAISVGPFNECFGEVKGFSLVYSGNFVVETELTDLNRLRVNMGINPLGFNWHLDQGAEFHTPESILVRSSEGVGGMSRTFHSVLRENLMASPPHWATVEAPIILNTWEALYFDVNHDEVMEMAALSKEIGVNIICVDDGWFGKRNNDKSSLGDWVVNKEKFPFGFHGLSRELNAMGIKLGVWFEPEMISEDSAVAKLHPDWILKPVEGTKQVSRNQYVLDLSRAEIRDFLFDTMSNVLSNSNIEYVKWDMNRPLTDVFSFRDKSIGGYLLYVNQVDVEFPYDIWQSETFHRYVLGLYELQYRLVEAFPNILFENCASGGGRFDAGMLYFSPLVWCSDNTDALARIKIQYGTTILYPTSSLGSHVSAIPNHITGNHTRSKTRGFVAMNGRFGFELDLKTISKYDLSKFAEQAKIYKAVSPIIVGGDLYRLWNPFQSNFASFMYVSPDKTEAVVFAFSINCDHWNRIVPSLCLQGLDRDAIYEVTEIMPNNIVQAPGNLRISITSSPIFQLGVPFMDFPGKILMEIGLPVKFFTLDDSVMFLICRLDDRTYKNEGRRVLNCRHEINELRMKWQNEWQIFYTALYNHKLSRSSPNWP